MNKSESISNLAAALANFQAEVQNPKNTSINTQFNSKYATLDEVLNTVRPTLGKYGLSFIQSTGSIEDKILIRTLLFHESGEWLESDPLMLPGYQQHKDRGQKKFNAQGAGSAITYARRYSLSAILGISSENDDDGNEASNQNLDTDSSEHLITPNQLMLLKVRIAELESIGGDRETIINSLKGKVGDFSEFSQMSTDQAELSIGILGGWVKKKKQQREPAHV
ncbi:ERF family protein [Paenibacillus cremeus]|uniref:ERF family protein n=1 Tax=Paenibacillus cremeus TaxID=2163881 RepID=A0A559K4X0_9BACL|nr:ERF family protein [Paenibacillus cremeus]TVY07188.1 ERF family protein [Paenibacillus cremeus]